MNFTYGTHAGAYERWKAVVLKGGTAFAVFKGAMTAFFILRSPTMSGKSDQLKGRVKEAAGAITDNNKLRREGKIDQAKGKVKQAVDKAADRAKDALDRATSKK